MSSDLSLAHIHVHTHTHTTGVCEFPGVTGWLGEGWCGGGGGGVLSRVFEGRSVLPDEVAARPWACVHSQLLLRPRGN